MGQHLVTLRRSIFAAIAAHLTGCGGLVVFVEDGEEGGHGGDGGSTSTSPTTPATTGSTTSTTGSGGCTGAEPITSFDGFETGFVRCADGSIDREKPGSCSFDVTWDPCHGDEDFIECLEDADCGGPGAHCTHSVAVKGGTMCICAFGCESDEDCGPGYACVCGGMLGTLPGTVCAPKSCDGPGDCPGSSECGVGTFDDGCGRQTFLTCRTSEDVCRVDATCDAQAAECSPLTLGQAFGCQAPNCDIGRPLVIDGAWKTAAPTLRTDWSDDFGDLAASCPMDDRAALADHYREVGLLEHASVSSFGRFTLQLLALGAPSELVLAAQRAGADEITHARIMFGLATALGGRAVGPGALPESVASIATSAAAIVESLVEEACVGETLGAMEARTAAEAAAHPAVRHALEQVAEDEGRHAELGWRTLAWMLSRDPSLAIAARRAFERATAADRLAVGDRAGNESWGVLSAKTVARLRAETLAQVVRPCFAAIMRSSVSPDHGERIMVRPT